MIFNSVVCSGEGGTLTYAFLIIHYPEGSTVSVSSGGGVLFSERRPDGVSLYRVTKAGEYVVSAVYGEMSTSDIVNIAVEGSSTTVTLKFDDGVLLSINPLDLHADVTGGWGTAVYPSNKGTAAVNQYGAVLQTNASTDAFSRNYAMVVTANKIAIQGNSLAVNIDATTNVGDVEIVIGTGVDLTYAELTSVLARKYASNASGVITLDVSQYIGQEVYVAVRLLSSYSGSSVTTVTRVAIES